jgi:pyruvate/2-oxoglutarate dehydrogenase complex dihydrolipoamide acyltransferase (E2) component
VFAITPFKLADIGEGIAEVELMKWFVKKGDAVKSFDKICEVQSDKATVEITSKYSGVITSVNYAEGDIVNVGASLVDIDTPDGAGASAKPTPAPAPAATAAPVKPAAGGGSSVSFKLADIGEGIAEVELMKWFVKKGDVIKSFDKICEVQSDKATVEITSKYSGVVESVNYGEGDIVKVGASLVEIAVQGLVGTPASAASAAASTAKPAAASTATTAPVGDHSRANAAVLTTPAVRKIAKENGIRLADIVGTGPKSRILKSDILSFISNGGNSETASSTATASVSSTTVSSTNTANGAGRTSSFFESGEMVKVEKIRGKFKYTHFEMFHVQQCMDGCH